MKTDLAEALLLLLLELEPEPELELLLRPAPIVPSLVIFTVSTATLPSTEIPWLIMLVVTLLNRSVLLVLVVW